MKCIRKSLGILSPRYPIGNFCIPSQTLFIDIETTGLYAKSSNLYLIGCAYLEENEGPAHWRLIQWFAESYDDERSIIEAFMRFAADYRFLIHFNGNSFDIPYLQNKIEQYRIEPDLSRFEGVDIYRRIAPYRDFLKLPNCKLKTLECFLGAKQREDKYTGGELIELYHEYVLSHSVQGERILLLHNAEDVRGMLEVVSVLAIPDLFNLPVRVIKVQANYYRDINNEQSPEIIMNLRLSTPLPAEISCSANSCYFIGSNENGKLRVPLYEEEMKYFYSSYKDYYYLPKEDVAIHKSVSTFVDKEFREQAKAHNCYTRKASAYLPQWEAVFTPFFKRSYEAKEMFFELTDEMKTQREAFNLYAQHILQMMAVHKNTG